MTVSRREVRTVVMRAIYAAFINGEAASEMHIRLCKMSPDARQKEALEDPMTEEILDLFDLRRSDIEEQMEMAYNAPLSTMTDVERAIISGGLAEFLLPRQTPIGVIIDEAVEMAKTYGSDGGARLVNAVLDKIVAHQSPPSDSSPSPDSDSPSLDSPLSDLPYLDSSSSDSSSSDSPLSDSPLSDSPLSDSPLSDSPLSDSSSSDSSSPDSPSSDLPSPDSSSSDSSSLDSPSPDSPSPDSPSPDSPSPDSSPSDSPPDSPPPLPSPPKQDGD